MEHNAKIICRTVISGEEQSLNKHIAEFRIFILFQYYICTFWPNSILFQGLENWFHRVGTLAPTKFKKSRFLLFKWCDEQCDDNKTIDFE